MIQVERLTPYPGNARKHSRKQIRQVAKSIERFGFTNPVLIDDDGQIIAGHGRVEADLFAHEAVETTLGTEALAHAVFSALRDARMRVLPHHMDWVVRLIGPERVCKCPSLPQAIRELAQRAKG